jgi:hypothetical protein
MTEVAETIENVEIFFAVEGHAAHHQAQVHPAITVREFVEIAKTTAGIAELVALYVEDAQDPLADELIVVEQLMVEFTPLHVATRGKIKTKVRYQSKEIEREFSPATRIETVTRWAAGPHGFNLQGDPSDFQLKHNGHVVAPDDHLGQVAGDKKHVTLELVFKEKPQG